MYWEYAYVYTVDQEDFVIKKLREIKVWRVLISQKQKV